MLLANVDGERVQATPGQRAACPLCGAPVIAKCGLIKVWHWAHEDLGDCDPWAESETDWHLAWKMQMPRVEIAMEREGVKHRADAVAGNGTVIEFQHSSISGYDIVEREAFYRRMVWVFDAQEPFTEGRIEVRQNRHGYWIDWKHARTTILVCESPVYLDVGPLMFRLTNRFGDPDGRRWGVKPGIRELFILWAKGGLCA
jgi:competence CoiA-like predicted nuclease